MAIRITNALCKEIAANALVQAGLPAQERDLFARRAAFVERIRQRALTECGISDEEIRNLVKAAKFPESLKPFVSVRIRTYSGGLASEVHVNLNGMRIRMKRNGTASWGFMYETSLFDYDLTAYCPNDDWYPVNDAALFDEFNAFDAEEKALHERAEEITATVTATVKKFRTVEKLLEAWPEAKDILPAPQQKAAGTQLAISREDLNALVGLPKENAK